MKWSLDGGALHLYDITDTGEELRERIAAAEVEAREAGAVVLYAELWRGDRAQDALLRAGFYFDGEEADVKDRLVSKRQCFVKVIDRP